MFVTGLSLTVAVPKKLAMPPPEKEELPERMQPLTVIVPKLARPPPLLSMLVELWERVLLLTVSVPEDVVGDVVGDLNSRRGRPLGMEAKGSATEIKAEVPMAEMLAYAPDLRSITGGQGEYTMEFERYEPVPGHLAQKVVSDAGAEADAVST